MERLTTALTSHVEGSSTAPQSNEDLNRLLDEITFRLERRFLLRLFDKHGVPSSQLDCLPPVPKCYCQCKHQCQSHGSTSPGPSTSASGSAYEDIEVLRYKARMIVGNAVDDALHSASYTSFEKGNLQLSDCRTNKNPEYTNIFDTIGGPDNMSATNSLYVVRRAALRTLLKYTCKGKANALLHLTDYLQQQLDNIEEENTYLDVKAKTKKPKVRFETLVEENYDDMDDNSDEYNDILNELPTMEKSKKKKVTIETAFEESRSDPVSLDSNYTFNLRKSARHSLSKYLHKSDAANAMMHLFDSTTRLELADSFAEIHASDDDMQDLLHTPYFGSVASSGAAPKKQIIPSDGYNRKPYSPGQASPSPDQRREKTSTITSVQKPQNVAESQSQQSRKERASAAKEMSPQRILVTDEQARSAGYVSNSNGTRENQYNVCFYCQSYLGDTDANLTTNNSNITRNSQHLSPQLNHKCNRHDCQSGSDNDYNVNGTSDSNQEVISTDVTNDDTTSMGCLVKDEFPEAHSNSFEYNPSPKKVIRLHDSSTDHHQEIDNDRDRENTVSQKVGYFDRVLNPPNEDARTTTKEAESIDMTEETRAKVGFWERWCGCHSNPNH